MFGTYRSFFTILITKFPKVLDIIFCFDMLTIFAEVLCLYYSCVYFKICLSLLKDYKVMVEAINFVIVLSIL